jgi:hypothetical protein
MSARHHGYRVLATLAAVFLLGVCQAGAAQEPPAASDGDALRAFVSRVEAYARLHQRLEAPLPPFEATGDPFSRLVNRRYLASAIRAARRHAKEGDIFTPDVTDMFRRRLTQVLPVADMTALIASLGDESGPPDAAVVNEPFHEEASHAVPPLLLQALPPLPGGIEYRVLGSDLVLWDVPADIVIDVLPDAFRAPSYV